MMKVKFSCIWRIKDPKMQEFLNLDLFTDGVYLAGGALRGLFFKEDKIDDFDLFFRNGLIAAEMAVKLESLDYDLVFTCPQGKLKTYKSKDKQIKIQLITENWYPSPESIIDVFDINTARIVTDGDYIYFDMSSARDARRREVNIHRLTFPMASFKRLIKYHDKGFKITNKCIEHFCQHIHQQGSAGLEIDGRFYID